jgi:hypothetical protein
LGIPEHTPHCLPLRREEASIPRGSQGQKRPADAIAVAIKTAQILTCEIEENTSDSGYDKAAQALGRKGGVTGRAELSLRAALRSPRKLWQSAGPAKEFLS